MLTREQILAADDLPRELVAVPEWGGEVYVRALTVGQRERWEKLMDGPDGYSSRGLFSAALIALTVCDGVGKLLFTEEDIPALDEKSSSVVTRLAEVALRVAKISDEDRAAMEKNFEASPSDSSASSSPSSSA